MSLQPGNVDVRVDTVAELRARSSEPSGSTASRVTVTVERWSPPIAGWCGRLGRLPGLVAHEVRLPNGSRPGRPGRAVVSVELGAPLDVSAVVAAIRPVLSPIRTPSGVLTPDPGDGPPLMSDLLTVDAEGFNPIGCGVPDGGTSPARLRFGCADWSIADAGLRTLRCGTFRATEVGGERPPGLSTVVCRDRAVADPEGAARQIVRLAASGLLCSWPQLPIAVGDRLGPELRALVTGALPAAGSDPLRWEWSGVRQRRAALREHAAGLQTRRPTVSVLLATRRPEFLRRAIARIAEQTYADLEIVVGLHGADPAALPAALVERCPFPVRVHAFPASLTLGEVLGGITERASGTLVTKLDDDDIYGPEHVWDLVLAWHYSGATLVGKAAEFTYLEPLDLTMRRVWSPAETYTEWVAGAALLMSRADLEAVGGWRPLPSAVDQALLARIHEGGGLVYATHPLGFIVHRRASGHTWDPSVNYFLKKSGRQWPGLLRHPEFGTASDQRSDQRVGLGGTEELHAAGREDLLVGDGGRVAGTA